MVVLIHGLSLNRHMWQWHVPDLVTDYRVLSYDLFGHGDSTPLPEMPSLSLFSVQLREVLNELLVDKCAIVGFSLGGMINRRFAYDYPDRVSALGIFNSPHERSPKAQKLVEERATQTQEGGPGATLDATIERWFTAPFRATRPNTIHMVRGWVLANDHTSYALAGETPGAETIIVPGLQHMGLVEAPNLFTDPLLEFLATIIT